jgi:hypothetical protein
MERASARRAVIKSGNIIVPAKLFGNYWDLHHIIKTDHIRFVANMDEKILVPPAHLPSSPGMALPSKGDAKGMSGLLAERMAEGGGVLCNDQNGLCLGFRGDIDASRSGIYTSIAKLASQLDSTVDGSGGRNNPQDLPLVLIQTEKSALLVKEYGGRTVVFRFPELPPSSF